MTKRRSHRLARRGAMMPLIAILLPALLIVASMVVNVAYMELTRTELRIAADSAARAAGWGLASTGDKTLARSLAQQASDRNKVAGAATTLATADVTFGVSQRSAIDQRYAFTAGGAKVNSVRVNLRRTANSSSGTVALLFPSLGGATSFAPTQQAISSQVEIDVALVLDRSGSMAYGDDEDSYALAVAGVMPASAPPGWQFGDSAPPAARWRGLVAAVDVFLAALGNSPQTENLSLVTYADDAIRESNLSSNYGLIPPLMDAYTQSLKLGRTNIGGGIVEGINALNSVAYSRPWAVKTVVVLTDGQHNIGTAPEGAAQQAIDQGVTVYTVTFSDEGDQQRMQEVAEIGGGKHFHASTAAQLQQVFREIAASLPTLLTQ